MPRGSSPIAEASASPAPLFVGTSGWAYPSWKPGFYPIGVPARGFLPWYAAQLNSVEVNYTFRKLPTPTQLSSWLAATPPGFRFSFKAPQRITHFQRLRESHAAVAKFVAALKPVRRAHKLGCLLFQLPPNFKADPQRLADFLKAPALRRSSQLQLAFEFRHPTWFCDATYAVLRSRNAALCVAEGDDLVTPDVPTATHRCYRLRRSGGYSRAQLKAFAKRFAAIEAPGEVFVYFKHEDEPTGALNAAHLLRCSASLATDPGRAR